MAGSHLVRGGRCPTAVYSHDRTSVPLPRPEALVGQQSARHRDTHIDPTGTCSAASLRALADNRDGRVLRGAHPLLRPVAVPVRRFRTRGGVAVDHEQHGKIKHPDSFRGNHRLPPLDRCVSFDHFFRAELAFGSRVRVSVRQVGCLVRESHVEVGYFGPELLERTECRASSNLYLPACWSGDFGRPHSCGRSTSRAFSCFLLENSGA